MQHSRLQPRALRLRATLQLWATLRLQATLRLRLPTALLQTAQALLLVLLVLLRLSGLCPPRM